MDSNTELCEVNFVSSMRRLAMVVFILAGLVLGFTEVPHVSAQTTELAVALRGQTLTWNRAPGADRYIVWTADGVERQTTETSMLVSDVTDDQFLHVTVLAMDEDIVLGAGRLRGPTRTERHRHNISVQDGMDLLTTMPVTTTPSGVMFTMPTGVMAQIDSWTLYRNGLEVASTSGRTIRDGEAAAGQSYAYTVTVTAPDWVSEDQVEWLPAVCEGEGCETTPDGSPYEDEPISGDGLTLVLPVEVPDVGQRRTPRASFAQGASSSSYVWHNTFIRAQYVRGPGTSQYYFGGDNRNFASIPGSSTRTIVRTTNNFSLGQVSFTASVSPTTRYTRNAAGQYVFNAQLTGTNTPTVQYINESGRLRTRVRHSAANPFQDYYPEIDYEWEYVSVSDGGVTARGLHDGAPSYETFYQPPNTTARTRVYGFYEGSFISLAAPMDQKGRTWCQPKGAGFTCPGFGNPVWV